MPLLTGPTPRTDDAQPPTSTRAQSPASTRVITPESSRGARATSFDVADFPMPTGREEDWRFTPVDRLTALLRDTHSGAHLAWDAELPDGVTLRHISSPEALALGIKAPADRASALAIAHADGAMRLDIPANLILDEPVRIRLVGTHSERVWGHVVVTVGRHAKAVVVIEHEGTARLSGVLSVVTQDGSDLTLVSVQQWDPGTLHLGEHNVVVGRDATFRSVVVSLGGDVVRVNTNISYAGPGGTAHAYGLYFADAGQHLEHRLFVDHGPPHCTSDVEYRGALQGADARTVWVGDVLIRAGAEGTSTYELNRNLLLTQGARADSVPNLEIETGEIVGAGHASATGRFDDEQLFYLQARGIPHAEALRLVVRGFFTGIIAKIPVAEVQGALSAAIERELATTGLTADAP